MASSWSDCTVGGPGQEVATLNCVPVVIGNVVNFLLIFAGVVAVFFIALSGYRYITSQGDPAKLDSARKTAFYAIGGLVFITLAWAMVNLLGQLTGVTQIQQSIGN